MATKLKNMRLTSVDLVKCGANQEADICLFKSADPSEAPETPTEAETNIFKRFIAWLRENPSEAPDESTDPIEKDYSTFDTLTASRESNEKLWQYTDALSCSIRSIREDNDLDNGQKLAMMEKSLGEFDVAMKALFPLLCSAKTNNYPVAEATAKSAPEVDDEADDEEIGKSVPDYDEIEEIN